MRSNVIRVLLIFQWSRPLPPPDDRNEGGCENEAPVVDHQQGLQPAAGAGQWHTDKVKQCDREPPQYAQSADEQEL